MSLSLNDLQAESVRIVQPYNGPWFADVTLDADATPSGTVSVKISSANLVGTTDPRFSGRMGRRTTARVVAGGGGWDKLLAAKHFNNTGGVELRSVAEVTSRECGERIGECISARLGTDYARIAGPASRLFAGRQWYVDLTGLTHVVDRPAVSLPSDAEVLEYDPSSSTLTIASESLILPGTTVTDPRFGSLTIRDVEQVFSAGGARATCWVGTSHASRFTATIAAMVREFGGTDHLKLYPYRVFDQPGDLPRLQAQQKGFPDLVPCEPWLGVPGVKAQLSPGQEVLVGYQKGDPAQPMLLGFRYSKPVSLNFNVTGLVSVGDGGAALAHASQTIDRDAAIVSALTALGTAMTSLGSTPLTGAALGSAISTALNAISSSMSSLATALPTTKLVSQ